MYKLLVQIIEFTCNRRQQSLSPTPSIYYELQTISWRFVLSVFLSRLYYRLIFDGFWLFLSVISTTRSYWWIYKIINNIIRLGKMIILILSRILCSCRSKEESKKQDVPFIKGEVFLYLKGMKKKWRMCQQNLYLGPYSLKLFVNENYEINAHFEALSFCLIIKSLLS